jgi:hypothetical protein
MDLQQGERMTPEQISQSYGKAKVVLASGKVTL